MVTLVWCQTAAISSKWVVAAAYILLILLLERNASLSLPLIANWYMHMLFASLLGAHQFVHSGSHSKLRGLPHMYWFVSNTVCISSNKSLLKTLLLVLLQLTFSRHEESTLSWAPIDYDACNCCFLFQKNLLSCLTLLPFIEHHLCPGTTPGIAMFQHYWGVWR